MKNLPSIIRVVTIEENVNGEIKEYKCLADGSNGGTGKYLSKEEALQVFSEVKEYYNKSNYLEINDDLERKEYLDHFVESMNSSYDNFFKLNSNEKYDIPKMTHKFKTFKPNKRKWSCKCEWCGKKISNTEVDGYYSVHQAQISREYEKACSVECGDLIWKEIIKSWIKSNRYTKFFNV